MFVWQVVLYFISGEGEDWCYLVYQCFCDVIQCSLAVMMCYIVCFGGVLMVFDDVEVEGIYFNGAEVYQMLYYFVEIVCFVCFEDVFLCCFCIIYGLVIQYYYFFWFYYIFCWIKIVQVCQQEVCGVMDMMIVIGSMFQDFVRNGYFIGVVG